jgi:hypothetical protein
MKETIVAIVDLASQLGMFKQTIFKVARRMGITPFKSRSLERHGQLVSWVTEADAQKLVWACLDIKRKRKCIRT